MAVLGSTSIIVFCGRHWNSLYPPNIVFFYNIILNTDIYSISFIKPIIALNTINKYIFIQLENKELNIIRYDNLTSITFIHKIYLNDSCSIWLKTIDNIVKYNIAYPCKEYSVQMTQYYDKAFVQDLSSISYLSSGFKSVQSIFYDNDSDSIFLVESYGRKIEEFGNDCLNQYTICYKYFRGLTSGVITAIKNLKKDYVAMVNYNKTIHIFFKGEVDLNLSVYMSEILNEGISSCIKIYLGETTTKALTSKQLKLYEEAEKGILLVDINKPNELTYICLDGFSYTYKIDYIRKSSTLVESNSLLN